MVASTSFLAFGLLGGFAYLAWRKQRDILSYGLAGLGIGFFLDGVRMMMGPSSGFGMFLEILHHIAFGVGGAFLAYVGAIESWKYSRVWKERRHEAELAFQAKLAAKKNEKNGTASAVPEPGRAKASSGKKVGV
jgi:hypothetical protein